MIGSSYVGFQVFLTTLERDGHRFKPKAHVLNTGLPLTKHTTLAKWNFIAEHCQKHLPAWIVFERQTCADSTFCGISRWFPGTRSFWYLTVRLVLTITKLSDPWSNASNTCPHWKCEIFSLIAWDSKVSNCQYRWVYWLNSRLVSAGSIEKYSGNPLST